MRIRFYLFVALLLISSLGVNAMLCRGNDDPIVIPMETLGGETGGSRSFTAIPITATYYSSLSSIVVNYLYDLGSVTVEIENQTTGEYSQSVVNALAGLMPFIISGTSGHWRVSFTLSSSVCYYGEFDI